MDSLLRVPHRHGPPFGGSALGLRTIALAKVAQSAPALWDEVKSSARGGLQRRPLEHVGNFLAPFSSRSNPLRWQAGHCYTIGLVCPFAQRTSGKEGESGAVCKILTDI